MKMYLIGGFCHVLTAAGGPLVALGSLDKMDTKEEEEEDFGSGVHRVKLETYSRRQVILMVIVFVALFLFGLGLSAGGPFVWRASHGWGEAFDNCTEVAHHSECHACVTYWEGEVVNMNPYHQVLFLEMAIENPLKYIMDWNNREPVTAQMYEDDAAAAAKMEQVDMLAEMPLALDFQIRSDIRVVGIKDDGKEYPVLPYTTMTRRVVCQDRHQDWW